MEGSLKTVYRCSLLLTDKSNIFSTLFSHGWGGAEGWNEVGVTYCSSQAGEYLNYFNKLPMGSQGGPGYNIENSALNPAGIQ